MASLGSTSPHQPLMIIRMRDLWQPSSLSGKGTIIINYVGDIQLLMQTPKLVDRELIDLFEFFYMDYFRS